MQLHLFVKHIETTGITYPFSVYKTKTLEKSLIEFHMNFICHKKTHGKVTSGSMFNAKQKKKDNGKKMVQIFTGNSKNPNYRL